MTRRSDARDGCASCAWFHVYEITVDDDGDGECRRFPPVIVNEGDGTFHGWPCTFAAGWCGEWEAA